MYERKETHMKKGNKRYKISIGIFFCSLLFIMPFGIAYAKEYGNVIIKAIIQKDGDDRHALQNVSFAIYKVADWKDSEWTQSGDFLHVSLNLDDMDSLHQKQNAQMLADYVHEHGLKGIQSTTNSQGEAVFTKQEAGMYLLVQEKQATLQDSIYSSAPSLFSVPLQMDGKEQWEVVIEPKFENKTLPIQDDDSFASHQKDPSSATGNDASSSANKDVQTKDITRRIEILSLFLGSGGLLLLYGKYRKASQNL